jgi:multiple sugar transport system permease protein
MFLVLVLAPVVVAIGISLYRTDWITRTWVGLDNYRYLATDPDFHKILFNTARYVLMLVPSSILLSLVIALLISPLGRGTQSFFRGAFYLPSVVGGVVLAVVWLWIFDPTFGLLNFGLGLLGVKPLTWLASSRSAYIAVWIVMLFNTLGAQIILFLAGLANIPGEVLDAAQVDGANPIQSAWFVKLPMLRPVFLFVLATTTINSFQVWETVYMLTSGGPNNASSSIVYHLFETAFVNMQYGLASAMGTVLLVIIVSITLFQMRMWRDPDAAR